MRMPAVQELRIWGVLWFIPVQNYICVHCERTSWGDLWTARELRNESRLNIHSLHREPDGRSSAG